MVYRFTNGSACADIEISDKDYQPIKTALEMRGFRMSERNPGPPKQKRLTADEVGALFQSRVVGDVRGPDAGGRSAPMGVVAGDIRLRGGVGVPL